MMGKSATSSMVNSGRWMSIPTKQLVNSLHCGVASNESRRTEGWLGGGKFMVKNKKMWGK